MTTAWKIAYWLLLAGFVLSAALNMMHVRAGFLTNHLADVAVPAWLYVMSRRHVRGDGWSSLLRWIGRTPERAAAIYFLASTATEVSQIYWPHGIFSGRFDPWDIVSYGAGLLGCYLLDKSTPPHLR